MIESIIGKRFGRLTVVSREPDTILSSGRKKAAYKCKCDCGRDTVVMVDHLRSGWTRSCGCLASDNGRKTIGLAAAAAKINKRDRRSKIVGDRYGNLTVISEATLNQNGLYYVLCRCDCGNTTEIPINNLKRGASTQCRQCGQKALTLKMKENDLVDGTSLCHLTQKIRSDNKTGVKGVRIDKRSGKYIAEIKLKGKKYHIGTFSKLEDAAKARSVAEEELFDPILEENGKETTKSGGH